MGLAEMIEDAAQRLRSDRRDQPAQGGHVACIVDRFSSLHRALRRVSRNCGQAIGSMLIP
jgi:hypothetical protein